MGCGCNVQFGELCDDDKCPMYELEPETEDLGGVDDGFGIISDADSGL